MRWFFYILAFSSLTGCTSTRILSGKFSVKPVAINTQFADARYANSSVDTTALYRHMSLWNKLSPYRSQIETLSQVSENATIHLSLENNKTLKVVAYENRRSVASFEIPVRKRGKYLILKNKTRIIPIPFIYFSVKEDKTILAPLQNNRIGIYRYNDESLWILFFGASQTGRSIHEYEPVKK
ncbi:hypothetical protein [Sphingobacterium pedocola]|uniref:Lipoprotein n=1 Tax=Sphingobacterium pedocola TaxID=2082722 RepID=A0ABR9T3K0_9SPHI|nr:hypothetical protein [Sphingobacterium pedocola]MBE8719614.1 hypothetical protein [Sphingobacterium pedocola]